MTPLFCDILTIDSVAPLRALDKLSKKGIGVYKVQKMGPTRLKLRVKSKETEKIFAIFSGSCYTVTKIRSAGLKRLAEFFLRRMGIAVGVLLLLLLSFVSNFFVLKIEVIGSGARYREEAEEVLAKSGIDLFRVFRADGAETARGELLSLPGVVFASVVKRGCVVTVTLEESEETQVPQRKTQLLAPCDGVLEELTVFRGTALAKEGDRVSAGQALVGGYFETENGETFQTFAVARCSVLQSYSGKYFSKELSERAESQAIAAVHLAAGGELLEAQVKAKAADGGFIYTVTLKVRIVSAVNL